MGQAMSQPAPADERLFRFAGRFFYFAALIGLVAFGAYILLRATGVTSRNFHQWGDLVTGLPMRTAADWIANIGIGMHYFMGTVLVLAWPILFSARIRARHRVVHRWTGRVYVSAGFLAGVGGLSFIVARHTGGPAHIAFAIWGAVMMLSAVLAYVHARAKRFVLHRAWAIRLFAMVLGSWLFDIEIRAWRELTGGTGMTENEDGPFDYAILYLFFVPNLLVAEFFIRNQHRRMALSRNLQWSLWAAVAIAGLIFVYSIAVVTATHGGKYGRHLLELVPG
ncbi:DUF2306 domain-containing protein [Povalibacter sp.]|uniref:DUF2306 domain-containing protein n=1 Tax=Povalibacter sp. TaxID=1962978 RepID=UPI002F4204F6